MVPQRGRRPGACGRAGARAASAGGEGVGWVCIPRPSGHALAQGPRTHPPHPPTAPTCTAGDTACLGGGHCSTWWCVGVGVCGGGGEGGGEEGGLPRRARAAPAPPARAATPAPQTYQCPPCRCGTLSSSRGMRSSISFTSSAWRATVGASTASTYAFSTCVGGARGGGRGGRCVGARWAQGCTSARESLLRVAGGWRRGARPRARPTQPPPAQPTPPGPPPHR